MRLSRQQGGTQHRVPPVDSSRVIEKMSEIATIKDFAALGWWDILQEAMDLNGFDQIWVVVLHCYPLINQYLDYWLTEKHQLATEKPQQLHLKIGVPWAFTLVSS